MGGYFSLKLCFLILNVKAKALSAYFSTTGHEIFEQHVRQEVFLIKNTPDMEPVRNKTHARKTIRVN